MTAPGAASGPPTGSAPPRRDGPTAHAPVAREVLDTSAPAAREVLDTSEPAAREVLDTSEPAARSLLGPWWNERTRRALFGAMITVGLVVGLVLGLREVYDRPVLDVGEPRVRVEGLTATVQVTVRNTSEDVAYCPAVGVAAIDRDGLDLAKAPAFPDLGDARLVPKASTNFVGVLTGISQQDFDEQLSEYAAFVEQENPCP